MDSSTARTVPKILHQMWIGNVYPMHIGGMLETWREHHPKWQFRFWTEDNLIPLANCALWERAEEISPEAPEQFRSDVARYEILYKYGGVWADADFTCQKPLDPLLNVEAFAGRETKRWINNALIGITPEHPLMADLVARLPANVERFAPSVGNTAKSGPQFFTPLARRYKITEYPERYFYPYLWNQLDQAEDDFPDSYAVHHWNHRATLRA